MESRKTWLERISGSHPGESWELARKEIHHLFGQPVSALNYSHHGTIPSLCVTGISIALPCCWKIFLLSFHCTHLIQVWCKVLFYNMKGKFVPISYGVHFSAYPVTSTTCTVQDKKEVKKNQLQLTKLLNENKSQPFLTNGSKAIEMNQIHYNFQFCGITSKSSLPLVQREKLGLEQKRLGGCSKALNERKDSVRNSKKELNTWLRMLVLSELLSN